MGRSFRLLRNWISLALAMTSSRRKLSSAEIVSDSSRFQKVAKQQSELGEIVAKHPRIQNKSKKDPRRRSPDVFLEGGKTPK